LAQEFLFLFESSVVGWVSRQIQAPVEDRPVDFVIRAFEMPIQQNVSWAISVSNRVTSWQKLSLLSKVDAKVGEWFVSSSAVDHLSSNEVLRSTGSDRGAEAYDLADSVGVLPEPSLAEGPKIEQSSFLVEVRLEKELVWPVLKISLRIHELLAMWLHWWNWSTAWFHCLRSKGPTLSGLHGGIILLLLSILSII